MHNSPVVTPRTPPDSAGIVGIVAAGNFANQRRQNQKKTIMDCFRDRSTSYTRSNSRNFAKPETTVVFLKEPRMRRNNLALLKSVSSRDLSRHELLEYNSSTASSNSSTRSRHHQHEEVVVHNHCNCNDLNRSCMQRISKLEQCIVKLTDELQTQRNTSKDLEVLLHELAKRLENCELNRLDRRPSVASPKKLRSSVRNKAHQQNMNTPAGVSVQPSKFAAWLKLSNFWKQRPSIQTLKDQNIYNDEVCFDTEIDAVLKHETYRNVPKIVVDCCDLIEDKYRRSSDSIEGIYRQCGDYNKIQTLRFKIDENEYQALHQENIDIHTLTGVLKLFLREIKSPLVSVNEAKTFIGKPNQWLLMDPSDKIEALKRLIRSLPEVNRATMDYLFAHFNRLTKVPLQQVSPETLSISVTPSIFRSIQKGVHMQDMQALLRESEILADCVKTIIEYQSRIFERTADRRSRLISVSRLRKTLSHPDLIFQNLF